MRPTALITGAAGGLGREFCKQFARRGYDLAIVGRRKSELEKMKLELEKSRKISVTVIEADLKDGNAPIAIERAVRKAGLPVEILVNNAGFGAYGSFVEIDPEVEDEMMRVNMLALTKLTKLFLPSMIKAKRGRILNVASTAAFQSGPLMSVYYATKAYVLSLSVALNDELRGTGVTVTCLCPGPTATGFQKHAKMSKSRLFKTVKVMDAATVVKIGIDGCLKGKAVVVPGFMNKLMTFGNRLVSRALAAKIAKNAQRPQ